MSSRSEARRVLRRYLRHLERIMRNQKTHRAMRHCLKASRDMLHEHR